MTDFMQAATPYFVVAIGTVLVPSAGFLIRTAFTVRQRLDVHEATDKVVFDEITRRLGELKTDSDSQNAKLDRLIERIPAPRRTKS